MHKDFMFKLCEALCVFVSLCFLTSLASAETTFTASVDSTRVSPGNYFEITFTLNGSTGGRNFQPPSFNDFDVLSGPNQSTSMQIVNGAVNSSVSYSYALQPRAEGKFTIGPATIEADGKRLQTQPVTVEVVKGATQPAQRPGAGERQDVRSQLSGNVMVKAVADRTRVYQGEQVTVSFKVYTRVQILSYNITKTPGLTGFWSEDLAIPKEISMGTEVVDGKQYAVGLLRKVALFPQRSGSLALDPMEIEVTVPVRRQSGDFFDSFFNSTQPVKYRTASQPMHVTVLPLPSQNVPAGFNGAVGKFQMDAQLDKQDVKTNDPVTLKVKISGRGNLKLLEPPALTVPSDVERFDPKITNSIVPDANRIAGSRTFEYLLIPRHAGAQKIPPFTFSYFDTDEQRFVSLRSPEFVIRVERGSDIAAPSVAGVSREDVRLLGEDIRYIKSGNNMTFRRRGEFFAGSASFYLLVLSPPFVFVLLLAALKRREKALSDVFTLRSRKAKKTAQLRLAKAKKFLREKKQEEFYAETSRALWGYLTDRLNIPFAELNREKVQSALQARSVPTETAAGILSAMDLCEYARFAPGSDPAQMEQVFQGAVRLVSSIEDHLR